MSKAERQDSEEGQEVILTVEGFKGAMMDHLAPFIRVNYPQVELQTDVSPEKRFAAHINNIVEVMGSNASQSGSYKNLQNFAQWVTGERGDPPRRVIPTLMKFFDRWLTEANISGDPLRSARAQKRMGTILHCFRYETSPPTEFPIRDKMLEIERDCRNNPEGVENAIRDLDPIIEFGDQVCFSLVWMMKDSSADPRVKNVVRDIVSRSFPDEEGNSSDHFEVEDLMEMTGFERQEAEELMNWMLAKFSLCAPGSIVIDSEFVVNKD